MTSTKNKQLRFDERIKYSKNVHDERINPKTESTGWQMNSVDFALERLSSSMRDKGHYWHKEEVQKVTSAGFEPAPTKTRA